MSINFGGRGYLIEFSMQRHLRESFLGLYAGGTAEIQKNIIAGQLNLPISCINLRVREPGE